MCPPVSQWAGAGETHSFGTLLGDHSPNFVTNSSFLCPILQTARCSLPILAGPDASLQAGSEPKPKAFFKL